MAEYSTTINFTMYYSMIDDTLGVINTSENDNWKPIRKDSLLYDLTENVLEKETLFLCRSLTSMLNKLTSDNCAKLITKIRKLPIDSPIKLQKAVEIIHQKAIKDNKYRIYYAKACEFMREKNILNEIGISRTFSSFLEDECVRYFEIGFNEIVAFDRQKFEIDLIDCQEMKKILLKDLLENETKHYNQCVGNCYFIGELFKLKMINRDVMLRILDRLFKSKRNVAVESFCAILITIGKFYETHFGDIPNVYFEKAELASHQPELPARIRFLSLDLLDFKHNSWCPRNRRVELLETSFSLEIKSEPEVLPILDDRVPNTIADDGGSIMVSRKQEPLNEDDIPFEKKPSAEKKRNRDSLRAILDLPPLSSQPSKNDRSKINLRDKIGRGIDAVGRRSLIPIKRKALVPPRIGDILNNNPNVKPYYNLEYTRGVTRNHYVDNGSRHLNYYLSTSTPKSKRGKFIHSPWTDSNFQYK